MEELFLVKFNFGLDNAFGEELRVLTTDELESLRANTGIKIYIGEYEGKHSEVYGSLDSADYKIVDASEAFKKEFKTLFPYGFGLEIFNAFEEAVKKM